MIVIAHRDVIATPIVEVTPGTNLERELAILRALKLIDSEMLRDTRGPYPNAFTGVKGREALTYFIERWQDELATRRAETEG